jgi:hypothetical protein
MNLVWHIIKKDLRRLRLPISIWAVTGAIVLKLNLDSASWTHTQLPTTAQEAALLSTTAAFMLSVALLGWIVQEDSLANPGAFWQSRPISGKQLLAAKSLLVFVLLVFLPTLVDHACLRWQHSDLFSSHAFISFGSGLFSLTAIMLYGMAIAAATRDNGSFVLGAIIAIGSYLGPPVAGILLNHPAAPPASAIFTSIAVIGTGGAAALLNQYLRRRTRLTFVILGATIIVSMLVCQLWKLPLPALHR